MEFKSNGYFNSIVGRVANRIGGAKFSLDNKNYKLYSILHQIMITWRIGFNKKIWKIDNIEEKKNSIKCVIKLSFT